MAKGASRAASMCAGNPPNRRVWCRCRTPIRRFLRRPSPYRPLDFAHRNCDFDRPGDGGALPGPSHQDGPPGLRPTPPNQQRRAMRQPGAGQLGPAAMATRPNATYGGVRRQGDAHTGGWRGVVWPPGPFGGLRAPTRPPPRGCDWAPGRARGTEGGASGASSCSQGGAVVILRWAASYAADPTQLAQNYPTIPLAYA